MKNIINIITNSHNFNLIKKKISHKEPENIYGLVPSFKPYFLAGLAKTTKKGLLWITSSWDNCEKIYENAYPYFNKDNTSRFGVFPELKQTGDHDITPSLRLKSLKMLSENEPFYIVAPFKALLQNCEKPDSLKADSIIFKLNIDLSLDNISKNLQEMGYERTFQVEKRGEYSIRGGILDIYPSTHEPVRIEFFGDTVDSIRIFDINSQISINKIDFITIFPNKEYKKEQKILDFLPEDCVIIVDEPSVIKFNATERNFDGETEDLWNALQYQLRQRNPIKIMSWSREKGDGINFNARPADSMGGDIEKFLSHIKNWQKEKEIIVVSTQHYKRFKGLLKEKEICNIKLKSDAPLKGGDILLIPGDLHKGFYWPDESLKIITDKDIIGASPRKKRILRTWDRTKGVNLNSLKPGDKVVHLSHGIGRFLGLAHLDIQGITKDFMELEYNKGDKLFVPIQQFDLLQKYIGPDGRTPNLSKLGGKEWTKSRKKAKEAAEEIAQELIELYSEREQKEGHSFEQDTPWQWELEASFPFEETLDQEKAILDVKKDMEQSRPMDRLLCGDAGYGKTEVALRAAFKACQDGKQVAILVPTTVLAAQHYETFSKRLKPFPVEVDIMSRFQSQKQLKQTSRKLMTKEIDIVVGTHRLIQKDIKFKDLGLIIIDEEQHFGVKHKETLKKMKVNVDILTMTATPIPRTLNLAMSGIRDLSLIQTPPEDRLPVKTHIHEYDPELIRSIIIRELERNGQVYFLHNRVQGIERVAQDIRRLVPFARVAVGHGQMDETELESIMIDFYEHSIDVLVCTTIVESGLDVPNVNSIIINNAHMFGLAQLYQLRGRVGRAHNQAYAYMLYPAHMALSEDAQKRLEVIRDFSHLGAGFQIAMKDLEIRGAGNILGSEQSGYIAAVGFDLYCQILKESIEEKRGIKRERRIDPPIIDLPVNAFIPEKYIPDAQIKLEMYRKIADINKIEEIEGLKDEFRDRFGALPITLKNLLEILNIKLITWDLGIPYIKETEGKVQIFLPGIKQFSLKKIQAIYEKAKVKSYFYKSILILEDLFGKSKKSLIPKANKKDPPRIWIPKLEQILKLIMKWKKKS